ncbi:MAG: helix-hairpin-helix domain-containing protein [Desulfatiglandales bacterium]
MKPLALKMVPPRIAERTSAIPILVLILLGFHCLKPSPSSLSLTALPCREPTYVQVEGEVGNPGVYEFCRAPRAEEVLSKAAALVRDCDPHGPFAGATLGSGTKLLVTREGRSCKVEVAEMCAHYKVSLGIPLAINRETQEGLTAIPGIGVKLAGAIVEERERRGGFKTLDEIAGVRGIGKALYGKIRPYVTL